ncbi:hypothetical protein NA57DRAFT_35466, partial [Rhizodiscina lignyota]
TCPSGYACIDDADSCDPGNGGADCSGTCYKSCGGFAGLPCGYGYTCVDNPSDDCNPKKGGADCPGICTPTKSTTLTARATTSANPESENKSCGGLLGKQCDAGYDCLDDPSDDCDPSKGGADCIGICTPSKTCGGFVGKPCADGYYCYNSNSQCTDCFGTCVKTGGSCGGFTGKPCPKPLVCVDMKGDGCDPKHGGADCPGVCVVKGTKVPENPSVPVDSCQENGEC